MKKSILLLEDDDFLRDGLCEMLESQNYSAHAVADVASARCEALESPFDLLIFDVMLPDGNGFALCRELREEGIQTPILFLTACDDELQIVRGLDSGADDYVTKPFSPSELMARVDAVYRRVEMTRGFRKNDSQLDTIVLDEFELNLRNRTLSKAKQLIELTQVEFQIIEYFFKNPNAALSRTDILKQVWGNNYFGDEKIVDVNIRRLRMKVEDNPSSPTRLVTIWGLGYKWITNSK